MKQKNMIMRKRQLAVVGMMMAATIMMTSCVTRCGQQTVFGEKTITENRLLKGFEEIEINGSPTVYYTQSDSFSVTVKGPESRVENILTETNGKTLVIRNKGKMGPVNIQLGDDGGLTVYVTSPDLTGVRLSGSGDFISDQRVDTDQMEIMLRGSGDIDIKDLICDRCNVELVGSGDIDLDRLDTKELSASLVGSGDIELHLWNTEDSRLALRGSGDIDATFHQNCKAVECELRGSGDITLKGEVSRFSKEKSGSGDVSVGQLTVRP